MRRKRKISDSVPALTGNLWLRQKLVDRQQLVATEVHLVALLEAARDHAFVVLHREQDLVDGPEDLVDAANGRVEVRDFVGHGGLAEHLVLDCVHEQAHF